MLYLAVMSLQKERQNAIKRLRTFLFTSKTDIQQYRRRIDEAFSETFLPNRVELEERTFDGVACDVIRPEMYSTDRLMIYVHGGSFIAGSRLAYRSFVSSLANACSCVAIVPEFRLAPAFPFPFSVNDIQSVFRCVYTERMQKAFAVEEEGGDARMPEILIAADTSGASIALGFLLNLKAKFRKAIKRVILFSPWLDISEDNSKIMTRRGGDEIFTSESVRLCAENYATPEKRNTPLVSPLLATEEQFEAFPEVYMQMGGREMFLDEAREFEGKLSSMGIGCTLDVWKDMMPLFQMADDSLAESHLAVEKIGRMVTARDDE